MPWASHNSRAVRPPLGLSFRHSAESQQWVIQFLYRSTGFEPSYSSRGHGAPAKNSRSPCISSARAFTRRRLTGIYDLLLDRKSAGRRGDGGGSTSRSNSRSNLAKAIRE